MQGTLPTTPSYSSSYSSDASSSSSDGSPSAVQRRTASATEAVGSTTVPTNRGRKRAHDIIPVINKPIPPFPATAEHTIVSRTSIVRLSDCVIAEVCGVNPPTSPSWQYLSCDAIITNRNRLYPNPQVGPLPTYIIRCTGSANRDTGFYRIGPIQLPFCTPYYKFSVSLPRSSLASGKSATIDAARTKTAIPILSGGIQLNEGTVPLQQRCPSMQSLMDIVAVAFPTHSSEIRAFMNCADFFTRQPIGGVVSALQRAAAQVGNVGEHEELFSRAMAAIEQSEPTHKLSKLVISDIRLLHVILLANAAQSTAEFPHHLWEMCVWACREYLIGRDFFELAPYVGAWGLFDRPSSYISAYLETLREACTTSLTGASTLMWYFVRNDAPSFIDANHLLAYVHGNVSRDNPSVLLNKLLSHTGGVTTAKFLGEEAHTVGSLRRPDNNKRICAAFDRAREIYRATFGNNFYEYGNPFGGESHFLLNDLGIVKPCAQPFQSPFRVFCCTDPQPPGPPAATRAELFVAQRAVDSAKDCIDNYLRLLIQPYAYAQSRIVRVMEMLARVAWQAMVDYSRRTAAVSNRKQKQQSLLLNSLINPGFLLAWEKEMQASFFGTDAYSIISPLLGKLCEFARAELMEAGDIPRAQLSVLQAITNIILSLLTATPDVQLVDAVMVAHPLIDAAFLRERVATILQTTDLDTQQEIHARVGLNRISESKPLQEVVDILGGRPIVLLDVNYCATERTDQGVRYSGNQNSFDNLPPTLCLKAEYVISRDMLDEIELYMLGDKTVPLDGGGGQHNLSVKPQKNKEQPIQIVLMEFHKWSLSDLKRLLAIFFWDIHYNQVQNPQPVAAAPAPELVSSMSAWQCTLKAFQSIYSLVCVGDSSALDAGALSYLMSWLKEGAFMPGRDFIYVRGHQHHTLGKSGMSVLATNCYRIKCNESAAVAVYTAASSSDSVIQVDGLLLKPPGLAIAAVCESIYDALGHPQTTHDIPIRINARNIRSWRQLYTLFCYAKRCVIESSTGVQLNHIAELLPELRHIFDRASADGDFVLVQDPNSSLIRFANQYPAQHRYLLDMTSVANEAEMASSVLAYQPTVHTRCLWDEMLLYT